MNKTISIFLFIFLGISCSLNSPERLNTEETWRLGWRMIENSWNEEYNLAESQFDSLFNSKVKLNEKFLAAGLTIKSKLSKDSDVLKMLSKHPSSVTKIFCKKEIAKKYTLCQEHSIEKIKNKELQIELIKMYISDQAIRGNIRTDLISKYQIDTTDVKTKNDWSNPNEVGIDELNRNRLKSIFNEYGFPTIDLVGEDGMSAVFLIIQHSDADKTWQKSQLPKVEKAAKNGDLSLQRYAYLFDRIRVNEGKPQRYGSQVENANREIGIIELCKTEKMDSLDIRRMEMGMMPIETYLRLF